MAGAAAMNSLLPRYKLAGLGCIRIEGDYARVQVSTVDEQLIPVDRLQFLLQFTRPASVDDIGDLVDNASREDLLSLVSEFERRGLLEREGAVAPECSRSIVDYLDGRYRSAEARAAIGAHLAAGRCVVLEDAFDSKFAEDVHASLAAFGDWRPNASSFATTGFSFQNHRVPPGCAYPEALRDCAAVLGSAKTKAFMSKVADRDCDGELEFGATMYLPGDYALTHADVDGSRNVTFNWYLAKDWSPSWGGLFQWCPTWQFLAPKFNSLALFNVSAAAKHVVTHVRPTARGRRFTVNGWWHSTTSQGARRPLHEPSRPPVTPVQDVPGLTVLGESEAREAGPGDGSWDNEGGER